MRILYVALAIEQILNHLYLVNDKERVAAALEKDSMLRLVNECIDNDE